MPGLTFSSDLTEARDGRLARATIAAIVTAFLAGLAWAALTPVYEITSGTGTIVTETLVERLEHPDGGVVVTLDASRGEQVEPGRLILALDPAPIERGIEAVRARLEALTDERDRVRYMMTADGTQPPGPAVAADPGEAAVWAEQAFLAAQLDLLRADRETITARIDTTARRRSILKREQAILETQLARYDRHGDSGAVRLIDREALERNLLQMERALMDLTGEAAELEAALNQNRLQELELTAERRRDAALRQTELEAGIVEARQELAELDARLARTRVRSVREGVLLNLSVSNPGEVIAPGDLIAEIVPADSAVRAEVEVPADRIGSIRVGMSAKVKVTSYDFTRFGTLEAEVTDISPSSYRNAAEQTVFLVTLGLPRGGVEATLSGQPIRPGMTVVADILSGRKTVLNYLLKPLRVLGDRALSEA